MPPADHTRRRICFPPSQINLIVCVADAREVSSSLFVWLFCSSLCFFSSIFTVIYVCVGCVQSYKFLHINHSTQIPMWKPPPPPSFSLSAFSGFLRTSSGVTMTIPLSGTSAISSRITPRTTLSPTSSTAPTRPSSRGRCRSCCESAEIFLFFFLLFF